MKGNAIHMDGQTNPPADSGNTNPPPANEPPANQPPNTAPPAKPPVVVNQFDPTQLMNAVESLPEKVANVFKEMVPSTPPANTPPANQPTTSAPPANQPPASQPPANQPPPKRTFADWWFGK